MAGKVANPGEPDVTFDSSRSPPLDACQPMIFLPRTFFHGDPASRTTVLQCRLRAGRLLAALLVIGCLQGCAGDARYLQARGQAPTIQPYPFLPSSSGSRAEVRLAGGMPGTTRPRSDVPGVELDLSLRPYDVQLDGILMAGPGGVLGFRVMQDGWDLAAGVLARPGHFRILGSASLGMRSVGLWRVEQVIEPPLFFSSDSLRDTSATSSLRRLPVAAAGLACSYVLGDERWSPFLAFQAQAGPRLAGETSVSNDTPLSFGSISGDAGLRLRLNETLNVVAAGGIVQGTGVFTSFWPRAWASLDLKFPR